MTKVYLLLRNNKQTGPHTLEELLQLGLKPKDLIWVEGKSTGWSFPAEIDTLKQYVTAPAAASNTALKKERDYPEKRNAYSAYTPPVMQTAGSSEMSPLPKVHVSLPENLNNYAEIKRNEPDQNIPDPIDPIEQKAEELRKRMQSFWSQQKTVVIADDHPPKDPIEQKAEELKKRILSTVPAQKTVDISDDQPAKDPIEQKAEELKKRILSTVPVQKTVDISDGQPAKDPIEQKAEELKKRIMSTVPAQKTVDISDGQPAKDPIEQKAYELKKRIMSYVPAQKAEAKADDQPPKDPIEQKAEELKKRIMSYVPAQKAGAKPDDQPPKDPIEQKAEELKKRIQSYVPAQKAVTKADEQPKKPVEQKSGELKKRIKFVVPALKTVSKADWQNAKDQVKKKAEELIKLIQSYLPRQIQGTKMEKPPVTHKPGQNVKGPGTGIPSFIPARDTVASPEEPIITKYSSTLPEREEAYTSWIYDQKVNKAKKITEKQKRNAAIGIAALLLLGVGFGASQYNKDKEVVNVAASTKSPASNEPVSEPLITNNDLPPQEEPPTQPVIDKKPAITKANDRQDEENSTATASQARNKETAAPAKSIVKNEEPKEKKQVREPPKIRTQNEVTKNQNTVKAPPKDIPPVKAASEPVVSVAKTPIPKETAPVVETVKKKKTLNEKVDEFFSKYTKKDDAPVAAKQDPPVRTSGTNSVPGTSTPERKAVHRDDKAVVAAPRANTNLAEFVQVTSNKPSENWMLGVHGLKVSLHNSGTETVRTAAVELRYFTEQNEVLEKKMVNFNNIPPGKTITLPVPDHRLADHAEFRLVNAW